MNMNIYPKYIEDAARSGWIVKCLTCIGVLQIAGCAILGVLFGGPFLALWLSQIGIMSQEAASASATFIGLGVGIIVGIWSSLAVFALAQVIDDLHALRLHTAAYVAFESDDVHLGK